MEKLKNFFSWLGQLLLFLASFGKKKKPHKQNQNNQQNNQ